MRVKLIYREEVSYTQASGALADLVFRGNSCFDPNVTGAGGQPMWFDQWASLYQYYLVLGSSVEVTAYMNGGATIYNSRVGIFPSLNSTAYATTDQERAEETPYARIKSVDMCGGAGVGQVVVKNYISTAKLQGIPQTAVNTEHAYEAAVTANPTLTWYWHIVNWVPSGATQSILLNVKITYDVIFHGRAAAAIS